jgi:hypothetical protein
VSLLSPEGERTAARPPRGLWTLPLLALPLACVVLVPRVDRLDRVPLLVFAYVVVAVAALVVTPRGLTVTRTWVIGYLLLQLPGRALFLLAEPRERPPLYAALTPGTGLDDALVQAMTQSLIGLVAFIGACALVRPGPRTHVKVVTSAALRLPRLWGMLLLGTLLLPVELALSASSAAGGGFVLSLPGLAAAGSCAAVCFAFVQSPVRYLLPMVAVVAYTITRVTLLHSKLALLACVVALVVSLGGSELRRRPGRALTVRGVVLLMVAVVTALYVFALSSGRSEGQTFSGSVGQGGMAAVSRSYGVDALIASNLYLDQGGEQLHGATFVELSSSWIPRQLWPDKPRSFSIRFGEDVFSFSHSVGEEFFAPSYSGEWVLNFGVVGLLVGWVLFGFAVGRVDTMPSLAHRSLWLVSLVHLVEGSVVAQAWLSAPFVLGGYWVLQRSESTPARLT